MQEGSLFSTPSPALRCKLFNDKYCELLKAFQEVPTVCTRFLHKQNLAQKTPVLVSCSCCNSLSQTWWLKTTEFHSLTVPKARNLKPGCWQSCCRGGSVPCFFQLLVLQDLRPHGHTAFCVSYKDTPLFWGLLWIIQDDLLSSRILTSL